MKKRNLFLTLGLSLTLGVGVAAGLGASRVEAKEVDAAVSTSLEVGASFYIDDSSSNWHSSNAQLGIWDHQNGRVQKASLDATSGYYKVTIAGTKACTSFNLLRAESLTDGATSFPSVWNQSDNVSYETGTNLLKGSGYSGDTMTTGGWDVYEKGFNPTAENTGNIFIRTPNEKCHYYVYTWESFDITVDGVSMKAYRNFNGATITTTLLNPTTKTVYNPKGLTGKSSYGVIKASFAYNTLANVGLVIKAVQYIDGSYEFQTKNLIVGASADNELELVNGAYYYGTDDWNLWDNFGYDATNAINMGFDANIAYDLDKADICHLKNSQADALRDEMDSNKGYVTSATWDSYNYNAAYALVNSQCTTPAALSLVSLESSSNNNSIWVLITVSSLFIVAAGAFFVIRRRKEQE